MKIRLTKAVGLLKLWITKKGDVYLKKLMGFEFLEKEQTLEYLSDSVIINVSPDSKRLKTIYDVCDKEKIVFDEKLAQTSRNLVWNFNVAQKKSFQLPIGGIVSDNKVLKTDFGYLRLFTPDYGGRFVFKDLVILDMRRIVNTEILIAPWSHYFRKEYYLFVALIAAKLCRIKDTIPENMFKQALVSYPLYGTTFEKEYLELIGFRPEQIIDSRKYKVKYCRCILGNHDTWNYPHIQDLLSLKKHIGTKLQGLNHTPVVKNRIYIRRAGRRQVVNETELIKLLLKLNFKIYEDIPRSVSEQFEIYNQASFIMDPHGSSFTNIIWCQPGTHLFELFPPSFIYDYFLYMSEMLGLSYSAYFYGPMIYDHRYATINDDVLISIPDIERYLNEFFEAR